LSGHTNDEKRVVGTLYVVATPIGNLGDMSTRALETLRACHRVVAEDTRRTRQLLTHFAIVGKPIDALHAHSSSRDIARLAARLEAGESLALATDAGTPVVSDPGDVLVRAAIAAGARVIPIPGASAVLAALVASGLAGEGGFRFLGFLPREGAARRNAIGLACETPETVILFESPNRTAATLTELAEATPVRAACVARELTKVHEDVVRGTLAELAIPTREWLGEVVIVLGVHAPEKRIDVVDDASLEARIDEELARGTHAKAVAERLAAWSGRPKRDVYEMVVSRKNR
jgi:16S rRNA (cytidine1402-2'-O)-methyltransferase